LPAVCISCDNPHKILCIQFCVRKYQLVTNSKSVHRKRMFKNIKDRVNNRLGKEPSVDEPTEEDVQEDKEVTKEEDRLIVLLEKARGLYLQKRLTGSVEITRSFAAFYRTVSCDIDAGSAESDETGGELGNDVDLSRLQKLAVGAIEKCIKGLEKRSLAYRNKPYKSDLSLSSTVYVTAPFLGLVSISISCTATAASLINSVDAQKA
jgi:hypothetical protein